VFAADSRFRLLPGSGYGQAPLEAGHRRPGLGSPLLADGKLTLGSQSSDLFWFRATREKKVLGKTSLDGRLSPRRSWPTAVVRATGEIPLAD